MMILIFRLLFILSFCILTACTASQPRNTDNVCEIFREKDDWYDESKQTAKKWGVPIHVQMAIMHQESHFVSDAKPPRTTLLGFIPWSRVSSAYGYAQVLDGTWDRYLKETGVWGADRDEFEDASDFIGWYTNISYKQLGISKWNAAQQYLAYHEGHGGFKRRSYLKKPWLVKVSKKVSRRASRFNKQLKSCKKELEATGWWFW